MMEAGIEAGADDVTAHPIRVERGHVEVSDRPGLGVDVVGSTPAQFAAQMRTEIKVIGKVIRDAGIRAD